MTQSAPRGSVLLVDDDAARLSSVSEALRARGHEVLAFTGGADARMGLAGAAIDVVVATAAIASMLDEAPREPTRRASWVVRGAPGAAQRSKFIASVAMDASPRIVAEAVAAALAMRRPKPASVAREPAIEPPPRITPEPPALAPSRASAPELAPPAAPPERTPETEAPESSVATPRRVAVVARDATTVRRLCEHFEASGMSARGFTAARTARDVALTARFDALVVEEQLDGLDAAALASRLALELGARAPRVVLLAQASSVVTEPAIDTVVRAPATPERVLEALLRTIEARVEP